MPLIYGPVLLVIGCVLTWLALPNAAGVSPRIARGFFGETVYPLICTTFVVLGIATLLAGVLASA